MTKTSDSEKRFSDKLIEQVRLTADELDQLGGNGTVWLKRLINSLERRFAPTKTAQEIQHDN